MASSEQGESPFVELGKLILYTVGAVLDAWGELLSDVEADEVRPLNQWDLRSYLYHKCLLYLDELEEDEEARRYLQRRLFIHTHYGVRGKTADLGLSLVPGRDQPVPTVVVEVEGGIAAEGLPVEARIAKLREMISAEGPSSGLLVVLAPYALFREFFDGAESFLSLWGIKEENRRIGAITNKALGEFSDLRSLVVMIAAPPFEGAMTLKQFEAGPES